MSFAIRDDVPALDMYNNGYVRTGLGESDKRWQGIEWMFLRLIGYIFGIGTMLFLIVAVGIGWYVSKLADDLPDYEVLSRYEPAVTTRIHAVDGSLMAEYAHERRLYLPIQALPEKLKQAFLSAEDKNFYTHKGISIPGLIRAVKTNLEN